MAGLRRLSAEQVEKILKRYGVELVSQKGSHRKWRDVDRRLQAIEAVGRTAFDPRYGVLQA